MLASMIKAEYDQIIFGEMHLVVIAEKSCFHEINRDGMTSVMDFI